MRVACWGLSVLLALAAVGCKEGTSKISSKSSEKPAQDGEFCHEHGVLEAVCTKCNPALIAVFKAKGDWCEEHKFPESFCPVCHPEKGGKPTGDVSNDGAPADGTKVRFRTKEAASLAGIETARAEKRSGGARLEVVATVVYDARRHAEVNARSPGVVKKLFVEVGATVKAGTPLAKVESASVAVDRSRLRAAATRMNVAKAAYDRERRLREKGISAETAVLTAHREWADAKAAYASARAALRMVGTGSGGQGSYMLRAPIAGIVTKRHATVGHLVRTDKVLFEVVDASAMWVEMAIPEDNVAVVSAGQKVTLMIDAFSERKWRGTIDYIAPAVDVKTRTATARVPLANLDGALRANMYGRAFIELADAKPTMMVPKGAIQRAGGKAFVFVKLSQDVFEARRIRVGLADGQMVELLAGVKPGELVATKGSFLLKTETLKGSIGAGCCDVE